MAWIDIDKVQNVTDEQRRELGKAISGEQVGLLTGIPGAGKTHTLAEFLKVWGSNVLIMAPTGKAAVRASEAMDDAGLSVKASTIHSALQPQMNGHGTDDWAFAKGPHDRLENRLIVIDESSMIPTLLMANVMDAVRDDALILLIGDPDQLPPVGAGKPFLDYIESGVFPHGNLSDPHRYSGRIGTVCQAIRVGENFAPSSEIDLEADYPENYRHIERSTTLAQSRTVLDIIDRVIQRDFDPIRDVRVLVATNDKSPVSRKAMNALIRGHVNDKNNEVKNCPFWVDDKVICLRSGNRIGDHEDRKEAVALSAYIANGEQGIVTGVEKKFKPNWVSVRFEGFTDRDVRFYRHEWSELDLGYAITTHKSQGSGFPVVIYVVDDSGAAKRVCSRSHVYTAMSRPKKLLFTVGKRSVLDAHIRKVDLVKRKTFLKERLRGEWTHNSTYFPTP